MDRCMYIEDVGYSTPISNLNPHISAQEANWDVTTQDIILAHYNLCPLSSTIV